MGWLEVGHPVQKNVRCTNVLGSVSNATSFVRFRQQLHRDTIHLKKDPYQLQWEINLATPLQPRIAKSVYRAPNTGPASSILGVCGHQTKT
jgi:hypothetical protein